MSDIRVKLIDQSVSRPETGMFTILNSDSTNINNNNNQYGFIIGSCVTIAIVLVLTIIAIVAKKSNHRVYITSNSRFSIRHKAKNILSFSIATLILVSVIVPLASQHFNNDQEQASAATNDALAIYAQPISINAELADEDAVSAVRNSVTVASATAAGYALSVYTSNKDLIPTEKTVTTKIAGLSNDNTEATILSSNTWGLAIVAPEDINSKVWYAVPDPESAAFTIKKTNNATQANDTTIVYYGVNVNDDLEPGEYTGVINYVAVANPITESDDETDPKTANIIIRNGSGIERTTITLDRGGEGDMRKECSGAAVCEYPLVIDETYSIEVELSEGFIFKSWLDSNNAGIFGDVTSARTTYTVKAATTIGASADPELVGDRCNPSGATISEIVCMQDIKSTNKNSVLSSMTQDEQYQLYDSRDWKQYYVAKLADGNIWMTQNLNHNIGDIDGGTYTPADTDIPSNWTPTAEEYTHTNSSIWSHELVAAASYNPGNLCWDGVISPNEIGTIETNTEACTQDNHYHLGNYYNWNAAIATSDSSSFVEYIDAEQSICPAGWTMPNIASFSKILRELNLTSGINGNVHSAPVYFIYGGNMGGDGGNNWVGRIGRYWSSTPTFTNINASALQILSNVSTIEIPGNDSGLHRGNGIFVRCLAR